MTLERYESYSREDLHNMDPSSEKKFVPGSGKWGLQGIVSLPGPEKGFVFFVTFGASQAGHTFKETITTDGILTWQSKPSQKLSHPQINEFINHDFKKNTICLLLRTNANSKYTYMGELAYVDHNKEKEEPVQFLWQVLSFEINQGLFNSIGLNLSDPEIVEDPYSERINFTVQNQLIKSEKLPFPKEANTFKTPGNRIVNIDFIQKAILSKENGRKGEELVVAYERERLRKLGINQEVIHVSNQGDGHGYDIESYNENNQKIFIEVKTSIGGLNSYFDVTLNEILVSNNKGNLYYIYRLFNYDKQKNSAEFYVLNGAISKNFNLQATQYSASYKVQSEEI